VAPSLTRKQKEILEFLVEFEDRHGLAPTHREICQRFGFRSYGTAHKHLRLLAEKGFLRREAHRRRGMELLAPARPGERAATLPYLGRIAAGRPIEALPDPESLTVPAWLVAGRGQTHFVLRVAGESMIEEGIHDGDWVVVERREGTPQGGPLSPLLANVLLDEVDKELEQRGHAFVRYADDLRVFVRTEVAGERVMRSLVMLFGRLHLRVNEAKSAVAPAASRPFLSFTLSIRHDAKTEPLVAPKALQTMKDRVRQLTRRTRGRSLAEVVQSLAVYLNGWLGYFRVARTKKRFQEMDGWIRHRLRAYQLKQWKRGPTVFRELRARGLSATAAARVAGNAKRWWRNSAMAINAAIPNAFFDGLGLPRLAP